jgi:hypothetical protein
MFYGTPPIVTNGLVLNLDCGNRLSYPTSGTTWTDLSGNNNNGTLTNGPTFNPNNLGSIVFDSVDDYGTIPSSSNWALGANGTIGMWAYFTGNVLTNHRFWCVNNNQTALDAYIDISTGFLGLHGGSTLTTTIFPREQWVHVMVTYNNGIINVYFNGVRQPLQGKTTGYDVSSTGIFFIGQYSGGGYYLWRGRISNICVYNNKGLTNLEVIQNYNSYKSRFGLT